MDEKLSPEHKSRAVKLKIARQRREPSEQEQRLLREVLRRARLRDLPPLPDIHMHRRDRRPPAQLRHHVVEFTHVRPQVPPEDYHTRGLWQPADVVPPPPMQSSWVRDILELVPQPLTRKYAAKVDALLREVSAEYQVMLCHFTANAVTVGGDWLEVSAPRRSWCRGRTDRYHVYLRNRSFLQKRLFLTHVVLRTVLDKAYLVLPHQLNDFSKYRDLGVVDLLKLRNAVSADLKKSEALITNQWYPRICKLLSSKKGLPSVPPQLWPRFLSCVAHVVATLITEAMSRTISELLEVMLDQHKVPYLKIDLMLEENSVEMYPSRTELYQFYHNLLDTIAGLARNLPALETWVNVASDQTLLRVNLCPHFLEEAHRTLDARLDTLFQPVFVYISSIKEKFHPLYDAVQVQAVNDFLSSEPSFDSCCEKIKFFQEYLVMISCLVANEYFFVGRIGQTDVIRNLKEQATSFINDVVHYLVLKHRKENDRICRVFAEVSRRAVEVPRSTQQLMEMADCMERASSGLMAELTEAIAGQLRAATTLLDFTALSPDHLAHNASLVLWLCDIQPVFKASSVYFEEYKRELETILAEKTEELNKQLDDLGPRLVVLDRMDEVDNVAEYVQSMTKLLRQMDKFDKQVAWINREEALFKFPLSTYPELDELKNIIFPFSKLIFEIRRWRRLYRVWMDGAFDKLNAKEIEDKVDDFYREICRMQKTYRSKIRAQMVENNPRRFKGNLDDADYDNLPAPIKLATKTLQQIRAFQLHAHCLSSLRHTLFHFPSFPAQLLRMHLLHFYSVQTHVQQHLRLIRILCNPALTQRHWNEMSQVVGFDLTPDAGTTLRKMIEKNLEHALEQFDVVSISADKEKHLQENLSNMFTEWEDVKFTVSTYKETDVPILTALADIQAVLDNHLIKTQTMRGSAFVKPFQAEIKEWYNKLVAMSDVLDQWRDVQDRWLHLAPIFSSADISAQMPAEAALFQEVDAAYGKIMVVVQEEPNVLVTASAAGVLELLGECVHKLEAVSDGVTAYLENKRLFFPRLFFLSNDEVLEILSETKDPRGVQPHLGKCFEGVARLGLDEQLNVCSLLSSEGEEVHLATKISTAAACGNVEQWLKQLEEQMKLSVWSEIKRGREDYCSVPRAQWVACWPGQVVLCIAMMHWTASVHGILSGEGTAPQLAHYLSQLELQVQETVALVKDEVSSRTRITLGALVVLEAHTKDVVCELLRRSTHSAVDFAWLAQLRYYWQDGVMVRMMMATVAYMYEYLGNVPRLVVTPLTERCYRTLVSAYHQHMHAAPQGPAATGKTETVKDLARAVATRCFLFNCCAALDHLTMGKFLKGVAASGAWACFDEFDRMEVGVLSVVAQQLLCLMHAVKAGSGELMLEGTQLVLNPACYICITITPGSAGRSELPDNLKVLFRPVAMVAPDCALIGEVCLYSHGFVNARKLALKIVTAYKLCSQQLSSQSHYDFGLRAVKAVLVAAGSARLRHSEEEEHIVVLRCIVDVSQPGLLPHDLLLFRAIISDLFPDTCLPAITHRLLEPALIQSCAELKIQLTDMFKLKVLQVYETMTAHVGFMLVGRPFSGKTSALKVLAATLTRMYEMGCGELPVECQVVNPKSVTISQLFGRFDSVSHKWTDGIVTAAFRGFVTSSEDGGRKWLVFDGPVDAAWVENMNSVLDDNRQLCLSSGEIIALAPATSIVFEVMDLLQASPATVSRCGMVHFEPEQLGWKLVVSSWVSQLEPPWLDECKGLLEDMFHWLVPPSLDFISKHCCQLANVASSNLVRSTVLLVEALVRSAAKENGDASKHLRAWLQAALMFAGTWGLGGTLDADGRQAFDLFYRDLWRGNNPDWPVPESLDKVDVPLPPEGIIHDYLYVFKQKGMWRYWPEALKVADSKETSSQEMGTMVPTVDSLKYQYIMDLHIECGHPMLLVGATGTGKTLLTHNKLMWAMCLEAYVPAFATLTAHTTANRMQELVLSKLQKHGRGTYGPPQDKRCVMFLDDMSVAAKDACGAQPPLELLRQLFDHGNWYDLKDMSKISLCDMMFVAAMGLPGGSRHEICERVLSHFSVYSINPFSDDSTTRIFTNLLLTALKRNGFAMDVMPAVVSIVQATLDIYHFAADNLRPTPGKCHYVFNLRDIGRVIQGCSLLKKDSVDNKKVFAKLWIHEVMRVFYDRLIVSSDRTCLYEQLQACVLEHFKESFDSCLDTLPQVDGKVTEESLQSLLFGTYMDVDASDEGKKYEEVLDIEDFYNIASETLEKYNDASEIKMDIVLFRYALEHLSRVCRVLAMPCGNALLVGAGGCGRRSLARLATAIAGYHFFQPQATAAYGVSEWREDLKRVLRQCGGEGRSTTLLLTDSQLHEEVFLQDVDSLLGCGEVPDLFSVDEQQHIFDMVRLAAQGGNRNMDISALQVYSYFVSRCRQKLHVVLCLSPIGASLRHRLGCYPSIVNCCTIDWYQPYKPMMLNGKEFTLEVWPEDALERVAQKYLYNVDIPEDVKKSAITACKYFHVTSRELCAKFFSSTGRRTYVMCSAYLELVCSYSSIIKLKQEELSQAEQRYASGLERLLFAEKQVTEMQKRLSGMEPELESQAQRTAEMMANIERETGNVQRASAVVREEEKKAKEEADAADVLQKECEAELAAAVPILQDAISALNTLTPADITLVKSMKSPPEAVKLVMAAVCVLKDIKSDRITDPATGKKVMDYWGPSKRVLGDMGFLQSLRDYAKDDIPPAIMNRIHTEFLPNKLFRPEVVAKASSAAEGLCKWVIAMDKYDKAAKDVAPKREKLALAEDKHRATMQLLEEKKLELVRLETDLEQLQAELGKAIVRKQSLEDDMHLCRKQLTVAEKLIGGLGGEKQRWNATAASLRSNFDSLAGDVLISCGIISYLAPFSAPFRNECVEDWQNYVVSLRIPSSEQFSLSRVLGSEMKIQSWNILGLPRDDFSVDNAIIVDTSRRWSLMLDPEGEAGKWVRRLEEPRGLAVAKPRDPDYLQVVEGAVLAGRPLLLEDVEERLDPSLEHLLSRQILRAGKKFSIALGSRSLDYNPDFRLYMTCHLRNPHFPPELYEKVTIVDFSLTMAGLQDQLLDIVVAKERPNLEEVRQGLVLQSAADENTLKQVEDNILGTLANAETNILEDEHAIEVLDYSKVLSEDIQKRQDVARDTREQFEMFRQSYHSVAHQSSVLYYCITNLPNVNPMYQFSLPWFINLYVTSIENSKRSKFVEKRLEYLQETFTLDLYRNVCRSMFEKDKLMLSFLLCTNIAMHDGTLDRGAFKMFLSGRVATEEEETSPNMSWLSDKCWDEVRNVTRLPPFSGFADSILQDAQDWKRWRDALEPHEEQLPTPWDRRLSSFQRLIVVRILRPDKVVTSVRKFVEEQMGSSFVTPPPFDIGQSYKDSNCLSPLIFMLSPGADPMSALASFAEKMGVAGRLRCVSLGQGQEAVARHVVEAARRDGSWVCLQNCHLVTSWLPQLRQLCEAQTLAGTSPAHRLWLTSRPCHQFPVSLLQNGVKMTNEPPIGLKQKLVRLYHSEPVKDPAFYKSCPGKDSAFARLLYGMCFFHAVVQERMTFGPVGWTIPYNFDEADFHVSIRQLQMLVSDFPEVPYEAIAYVTGACNYGGRVADNWDRRIITTMHSDFVNADVVNSSVYMFSQLGFAYTPPRRTEYQVYTRHIEALPSVSPPEACGLHANAALVRDACSSEALLGAVLLVHTGDAAQVDGLGPGESLLSIASDILDKLPSNFDVQAAAADRKHLPERSEAMSMVLLLEMERFNGLLTVIRSSLEALRRALAGLAAMPAGLEAVGEMLLCGKVPATWRRVSYPSRKPLAGYVRDLLRRTASLQTWCNEGELVSFWLPGFFSPRAFLVAVLQEHAREHKIPIDLLDYDFDVISADESERAPDHGVLVHGVFLNGAHWDSHKCHVPAVRLSNNHHLLKAYTHLYLQKHTIQAQRKQLAEQRPGELVDELPLVWVKPCEGATLDAGARYECPLYHTYERNKYGCSNFIASVLLDTDKPTCHWVKRGVALVCQPDDKAHHHQDA